VYNCTAWPNRRVSCILQAPSTNLHFDHLFHDQYHARILLDLPEKCLPTYLPTYLWLYSPLLGLCRFFRFLIFYRVSRTPWKGDQPVARPLPTHRTAQTRNKRTQTSMPPVGLEPTILVFEQARRGHCDRPRKYIFTHNFTEQSPSRRSNLTSTSPETPSLLWRPKVHYCVHRSQPQLPIPDIGRVKNVRNKIFTLYLSKF
jgi:hypothetical protein